MNTTTDINWNFPYPSRRSPVFAKNVVATSQPLAAQAGLQAMIDGGNAVDAALAAAIALTVVEPCSNGIGSDAFALVWDGSELHGLNASGGAPAGWTPDRFKNLDAMPERGWDSVTVPGCVDAWVKLSERFGKLPFERLFRDGVRFAREGFAVTPVISSAWNNAIEPLSAQPDFARSFLPNGHAPRPGERWTFEDQARTLEAIANTRGEAFYRGTLADAMVGHARAKGGALSEQDLGDYVSEWVTPISTDYAGATLHEIPPNGQGIAALMALGICRHLPMTSYPLDSPDGMHLAIEAMKLAHADMFAYVAEPNTMNVSNEWLLDDDRLKERAQLISMDSCVTPVAGVADPGGTVYLTTADENGMMVSFIQSNFMGFGSGVVAPGTGISFQNRGAGFVLDPGHPNEVGPGKRPFHTIIPGFVTRDNEALMSFGVMGGHMQSQGHLQMMLRIIGEGLNPQAASDAPRWHVNKDFSVTCEDGTPEDVIAVLTRRGHRIVPTDRDGPFGGLFGGAQLALRVGDGYCAGSDHRKDGQAVGY